jgi:GPH family glycoside/pentoside/hexuronide:cation symporter
MSKDTVEVSGSTDKKLPLKEKIAWGAGGFGDQLAVNGLNNLFVPIYNIGFGMNSVLIGWAMAIPRIFDMISDPLVGNISDNCRSRFGRRRPFIFAGAFLMALTFALSYMASPYWGNAVLFAYAVIACICFYLMYTLFAVPYNALGLELVEDYDERANVQKFRMIFASAAVFLIPWLYKLCNFMGDVIRAHLEDSSSYWYDPLLAPVANLAADQNVPVELIGVRYLVWILAIIIVVTALPAALFTREKVQVGVQPKIKLVASGRLVLKNRSFRTLCLMIFLIISGIFFMGVLMTYANIFYIFGGDRSRGATWNGIYGTVNGAVGLASTFLIPVLVRRFDKKKVLLCGLGLVALAIQSSWFLLDPTRPWLQLILAAFIGFGMTSCWLLNGAFIADICDEDEYLNGYRREGMFSAFFGFVVKMAFAGIAFTLGYVLQFIGYDAGAERMSTETLVRLRMFIALFPSSCLILAIIVFSRYRLGRERVGEIQSILRARRQSNPQPVVASMGDNAIKTSDMDD